MATFHFNLVAPDKLLFSGEVDQVDVPGMEGDFGVLADYATSLEDLDLAMLAARIAETEEKIKRIEVGSLLDRELERLDHFKAVDTHLQSTGMH